MEIRYIRHSDIDRRQWDRCIAQAVNGNIYGYAWYLDIVCDRWDALVEGDYESVFPLTRKKKYGIAYLYQPPFAQQLGIYTRGLLTEEKVNRFLNAIPSCFRLAEVQLNTFNRVSHPGFSLRMRPNLEMELIRPYEEIFRDYSTNLKRNLKQAASAGWIIHPLDPTAAIIRIFRQNRGRELATLSAGDYDRLVRLTTACRSRQCLLQFGLSDPEGNLHAGAVILRSHKRLVFLFSAVDDTARAYGGMSLLIDHVIREYSGSDLIFDFEGSEDENLARFYRGFGAKEFSYPFIRRDRLPAVVRLIKKLLDRS